MREYNPINTFKGLSPVIPASFPIDQHNASSQWNYSLLKNGARPSGIITFSDDAPNLNLEQVKELEDKIAERYSGAGNVGRPIGLKKGISFEQLSLNPIDMDFNNTEKSAAHKIALAFGVPMQFLNTEQSKFDNLRTAYEELWDRAVRPMVDQFLGEFNHTIVPKFGDGLEVKIDEEKVPVIIGKRARQMESLEKVSYLTINEKRRATGFEDIDGGDTLLTEFNKVPLSEISSRSLDEKSMFIKELKRESFSEHTIKEIVNSVYRNDNS